MAAAFLAARGFELVARNVHSRYGETDLICRTTAGPEELWLFVEVRTFRSDRHGRPEQSLTPRKLARMRRLAQGYLAAQGRSQAAFRLDAVTIFWPPGGSPNLQHWPGLTG